MSHFVVTGAQASLTAGVVPNRLEINDLIKNQDQFSLYIQALIELQKLPQDNPLSHFGVGGIHGLPYQRWEGSGNATGEPDSSGGYCCHGTVLFPTWHRPYVALYEVRNTSRGLTLTTMVLIELQQLLQQHALDIAKKYQDQSRWLRAAQNLRAPYWDWAVNSIPPPEVISLEYLDIVKPEGKKTVPNPLFQYKFDPIHPSFKKYYDDAEDDEKPLPYQDWKNTIRHPNNFGKGAKTDVVNLTAVLKGKQSELTTATLKLLRDAHIWHASSNNTVGDGDSASNSLEAVHDKIHVAIGGHMGDPAVAGFDPIFFLHHCNVDRILALWGALNPGVWVSEGDSSLGTFTIHSGTPVDTKTDLTPFWKSEDEYWKSNETESTGALKYSYPEFDRLDLNNRNAVKIAIGEKVKKLYDTQAGGKKLFSRLLAQPSAEGVRAQEASNVINDWSTRIHVKKYELSGSFSVLIFLGEVPEDPEEWSTSPSYVGGHHVFANGAAGQCDNCRSQADLVVEGFVHLNLAIAEHSGLPSYEPSVVHPYLKDNLSWRIQSNYRTAVDPARVPSLEVTVLSAPLSEVPGTTLPISGTPQYFPEITYGRPGGARQAQA